jgi:hypothetical protein
MTSFTIPCRAYTDKPHVAGSQIQLEYGEKIAKEWESYKKFDKVETFPYNVLLSYLETGQTNVVQVFNDSGHILHTFKGKETVMCFSIKIFYLTKKIRDYFKAQFQNNCQVRNSVV